MTSCHCAATTRLILTIDDAVQTPTMSTLVALALLLSASAAAAPPPTVQLPSGLYTGLSSTLPGTALAYNAFLGVPFAAPPARFSAPAPRPASPGARRNATALPPACPQNGAMGSSGSPAGESEDCQFVNVWAPAGGAGKAPVMVWLVGGALLFGTASAPGYDGARLAARHGVVLVAVNYRVSALGFPGPAPGIPLREQNLGFLDQRAALRWVRDNVASFGGDGDKVTVFGESAGGRSVDFLLVAPEPGPPLFRAGIVQSGSAALSPGSLAPGDGAAAAAAAQQEPLLVRLARAVGCGGEAALACLRAAPVKTVMDAVKKTGLSFGATDDGGRTTARDAEGVRAGRRAARASVMIGTTAEELKGTMSGSTDPDGKLDDYVKRRFPGAAGLQAKVAEAYRVGAQGKGGFATDFDAIAKLATDMEFTCVTSRESKSSAAAGYRPFPFPLLRWY